MTDKGEASRQPQASWDVEQGSTTHTLVNSSNMVDGIPKGIGIQGDAVTNSPKFNNGDSV